MADARLDLLRQKLRDPKTTAQQKVDIRIRLKFLQSQNKKEQKQASREKRGEGLLKDARQAAKTAEKALNLDPLGRVNADRSEEMQDILDQERSLSDPFNDAYVGRRSGQMQDFISRYSDSTQGYDSKENEALRDARRRETDRGFQSGRAALARGQNNARTSSTARGAQLAELARSYGTQSADAENDIFMTSANEKQRRLEGLGNIIGGVESTESDRSNTALANYKSSLQGAEVNELGKQNINLGQEAAERAAQVGGTMGILGIQEARRNAEEQNKLIREGYASNERISNNHKPTGNPYADELDKLIAERENAGKSEEEEK